MHSYRSLHAWQLAHELAIRTLRALGGPYDRRSHAVFDQMRRAAVSIEANVVEGYALGSPAQFQRHVRIALGSAAEYQCLLRLAEELAFLPAGHFAAADPLADRCLGTLRGLLRKSTAGSGPAHGARLTAHG